MLTALQKKKPPTLRRFSKMTKQMTKLDFVTVGDIERIAGHPKHVITRAIDRHGPLPAGRAGIVRIWSRDQLPEILASIERTRRKPKIEAAHKILL